MNWIESLQRTIDYIENHLLEDIDMEDLANISGYCAGHLSRGFHIVTGYSIVEYIRLRWLSLAGKELHMGGLKVIDVAVKYGYDSPDAFSRAFRRFHGFSPAQASDECYVPRSFLPLQIHLSVQGGEKMNYTIQALPAFEVIGQIHSLQESKNSFEIIPELWNNFMRSIEPVIDSQTTDSLRTKTIWQNNIGEFGICFESPQSSDYMIAGKYRGGEVPEGFEVRQFPALTWAQFTFLGPVPQALQNGITQIFREWLPNNPEYQLDQDVSIEFYPMGDGSAADYHSQIWIPVKKKS